MLYLQKGNILSNNQLGFRAKLSTETALTVITDEIYHSMDNKKISLLTLCGLSEAFDGANHILINKCLKLKIDSFWFSSYLRDRTQCVRIKDIKSIKQSVEYVVPQGSILGPILFSIFVNDLADNMDNYTMVQYADDT